MSDNELNYEIKKRDDAKYLKRDKENNIVLTQGQYDLVTDEVGQYASAHAWIELKNTHSQCLVKNFIYNSTMSSYDEFIKRNGKDGIKICKYNNLIIPYIGSEIFNVETVKYFFAKFSRGKQKIPTNQAIKHDKIVIITLFLKKTGACFFGLSATKSFNVTLNISQKFINTIISGNPSPLSHLDTALSE